MDPKYLATISDSISRTMVSSNEELISMKFTIGSLPKFIRSIFYVGKGKDTRIFNHFKDALKKEADMSKEKEKIARINEIWDRTEYNEPQYLILFSGISQDEAYTREAILIDALWPNLTNEQHGRFYMKLNFHQRKLLAATFMDKSFFHYIENGAQSIPKREIFEQNHSNRPAKTGGRIIAAPRRRGKK